MRYLFWVLIFSPFFELSAQTDSTNFISQKSLFTLSHKQIERLPASNFMELVNGAFPFVYGLPLLVDDYTYEVNGMVTINPNAINLSQIETIRFYPVSTQWSRGSMVKKGIFVITTCPSSEGKGWIFSSKTGLVQGNNQYPPPATMNHASFQNSKPALLSINELGFVHHWNKAYINAALGLTNNDQPQLSYADRQSTQTAQQQMERYRFSGFGGYTLTGSWKLEGGFFYTNRQIHSRGVQEAPTIGNHGNTHGSDPVKFVEGSLSITGNPFQGASNSFKLGANESNEKALINGDYQNHLVPQNIDINGSIYSETKNRIDNFSASDLFTWSHRLSSQSTFSSSLLLNFHKNDYHSINHSQSSSTAGIYQSSFYWFNAHTRSFILSPNISLQLVDVFHLEGGVVFEHYQTAEFSPSNQKPQWLPQASASLNLLRVLDGIALSTLTLNASYTAYLPFFDRTDLMETHSNPVPFTIFAGLTGIYPTSPLGIFSNPTLGVKSAHRWSESLTIGGWKDRLSLRVQYLGENLPLELIVPVYNGSSAIVQQPAKRKAWEVEINAAILSTEQKKWNLQALLFNDQYYIPDIPSSFQLYTVNTMFPFKQNKDWLKGGWRMDATIKRIFFQTSVLFDLNREKFTLPDNYSYSNHYMANFLLVGYEFKTPEGSFLHHLSLDLQARNLLTPKNGTAINYQWRYFGLGALMKW